LRLPPLALCFSGTTAEECQKWQTEFGAKLRSLHRWLDLPDIASLMAPKLLLVQQCSQDGLFPLAGMKEAVEKWSAVYAKAGAKEKFSGRIYDAPHQFTRKMQDEAFAWFDDQWKP
jgi:hypothetical protein